ncbi:hypothetical protein [Streptomyces sp. AB3(2024)]|uniref:hypothetical protein n=1 Tax=Streptomyces sp. AB3(2024) TaxID=3317321 RepID=UPI0035A3AB0D
MRAVSEGSAELFEAVPRPLGSPDLWRTAVRRACGPPQRGDLLARDSTSVLGRYYAAGTGTFAAHVKIGADWRTYATLS